MMGITPKEQRTENGSLTKITITTSMAYLCKCLESLPTPWMHSWLARRLFVEISSTSRFSKISLLK